MIRRYYEAKLKNEPQVTMWGTGTPVRDFVYAGDVARAIPIFIDQHHNLGPINISSGIKTSIKTLAMQIAKYIDYQGSIKWDSTKPDGQKIKVFDVKKLTSLGISCSTELQFGLKKTIDWFISNYANSSDGLRR
jgi:GDP-L-fucose synthase